VTLNFAKNKLIVSTIAPEIGEATENVAVKYSGKEVSISFNPDFLLDALRNLTAGEVSMDLTDDLSPGVLHDDTPFIYVLMPMRVR
jgi:DNA polymerase-3 subunit beta